MCVCVHACVCVWVFGLVRLCAWLSVISAESCWMIHLAFYLFVVNVNFSLMFLTLWRMILHLHSSDDPVLYVTGDLLLPKVCVCQSSVSSVNLSCKNNFLKREWSQTPSVCWSQPSVYVAMLDPRSCFIWVHVVFPWVFPTCVVNQRVLTLPCSCTVLAVVYCSSNCNCLFWFHAAAQMRQLLDIKSHIKPLKYNPIKGATVEPKPITVNCGGDRELRTWGGVKVWWPTSHCLSLKWKTDRISLWGVKEQNNIGDLFTAPFSTSHCCDFMTATLRGDRPDRNQTAPF